MIPKELVRRGPEGSAMASTTIILGGGVGGLTAANELRQLSGPEHRVVLIERQQYYLFTPSLLWAMVGTRLVDRLPSGRTLHLDGARH